MGEGSSLILCDSKLRSFIEKEGKDNGVDVVKRRNKVTHTTYSPVVQGIVGRKQPPLERVGV